VTAREDIADLVDRYADGVTRRDVAQWSSCWADDASWAISPTRVATGRDAIVAMLEQAFAILDGVVQNVLHGTVSIDGAAGRGRWYLIEHMRRVSGETTLLLARYEDTYVERDGCWLFSSRALVPSYQGPPDLSGAFNPTSFTLAR
jgi:hypothetical protein